MENVIPKGKRTNIDWSNHQLTVTKNDDVLIHRFRKPNTICGYLIFINACGVLTVTGDYGNYVFCRGFVPSDKPNEGVSDGYWLEKLSISSCQEGKKYDPMYTVECLKEAIAELTEEDDPKGEIKEYYEECINLADDELDYTHYAYRELPSCLDYESVIFKKEIIGSLKCVFDAFEAMCWIYREKPETIIINKQQP